MNHHDLRILLHSNVGLIVVETYDESRALTLLRGALQEIFFVDLPAEETRQIIFEIHSKRRDFDPAQHDLGALAGQCDGFTGAEIEQAIVGAANTASACDETLQTHHIQQVIANTQPLSVVMAEKMTALRM